MKDATTVAAFYSIITAIFTTATKVAILFYYISDV